MQANGQFADWSECTPAVLYLSDTCPFLSDPLYLPPSKVSKTFYFFRFLLASKY